MLRKLFFVVGLLVACGTPEVMSVEAAPSAPPQVVAAPDAPPMRRSELAGESKDLVPLFALGDVDENGSVDQSDAALIDELAEGLKPAAATCPAAADIDRDGAVTGADSQRLKGKIYYGPLVAPALVAQPALPCAYTRLRFAATPDISADETPRIRLLGGLTTDDVDARITTGAGVELLPAADAKGFELAGARNLLPGATVRIALRVAGALSWLTLTKASEDSDEALTDHGTDPTDHPAPPPFGEEIDALATCPQERMGCQALLLDFAASSLATGLEFDIDATRSALTGIGCNVAYAAPRFLVPPAPTTETVLTLGGVEEYQVPPDAAALARALQHNRTEWAKVRQALATHRTALGNGASMAIQVVNAHGTPGRGGSCGAFGPAFNTGVGGLGRDSFHAGNWVWARGNVCNAMAMDLSCYGGKTTMAVRNLNNAGQATCNAPAPINHGWHAAFYSDLAASLATSSDLAENTDVLFEDLGLSSTISGSGSGGNWASLASGLRGRLPDRASSSPYSGYYADRGYNHVPGLACTAATHSHSY
jgi:hypothetical protein